MPRIIVPRLTDDEGTLLSLLVRVQPATAYKLSKIYAESPVSNFGVSKGKIYPLIRRLRGKRLIQAAKTTDKRGTESLAVTRLGDEAVRHWVLEMKRSHMLLEDPLRTKVQAFDMLSVDEQIEWIASAKASLEEKLEEVREYAKGVTVPYKAHVVDNAVTALRNRIAWVERIRRSIAQEASKL